MVHGIQQFGGNRIGRITPLGVVTEFSAGITPGANPGGITAGPDGNLWFTEQSGNRIGRITPLGVVTEFSAGISAGAGPGGIATGPDGNLWFTEAGGNRIGRITPLGVVTEFSAGITPGAGLVGITAGPDGNLWFTEQNLGTDRADYTAWRRHRIQHRHHCRCVSSGITAGPDGNLWFTEAGVDRIGRITPDGVVTEFSTGITAGAAPLSITAGPDGNLWFMEQNLDRIGRITTGAPPGATAKIVVEYYNASLDHYFITWVPAEIAILDAGATKGWVRTGHSFKTHSASQQGTSPVCRYYIPPGLGDSHFFGRGTVECNATGQKNPSFILEEPNFMHMFLPVIGVCPAFTIQVYRVFNNHPDANHRYMTNAAVRDQMVTKGWLVEGDGPDFVVMCAPQ